MSNILSIFITFISAFFIISSIPKIINLKGFITLTADYGVVPGKVATILGALFPFVELILGIMLIFPEARVLAATGIIILLVGFQYAVINVLKTGKTLSCGCYGKLIDSKVDNFTILKIRILILISLYIVAMSLLKVENTLFKGGDIVIGIALSITILAFQVLWSTSKQSREILKNTN